LGSSRSTKTTVAFRSAAGNTLGAGAGLGVGALMIGSLYVLAAALAGPDDPTAPQPSCDGGCIAKTMVPLLVIPTIVGAIAGYFGARGGRFSSSAPGRTPGTPVLEIEHRGCR
jgi:hypothetical protein